MDSCTPSISHTTSFTKNNSHTETAYEHRSSKHAIAARPSPIYRSTIAAALLATRYNSRTIAATSMLTTACVQCALINNLMHAIHIVVQNTTTTSFTTATNNNAPPTNQLTVYERSGCT